MHLHITFKRLALILAGSTFALGAAAQWQWIDKDGRKVFSDRAPPSDVAPKDILKQPGGRGRMSVVPVDAPEAGVPPAATPRVAALKAGAPKISGKDTDLLAKKKKLEEEEAAKKKLDEENATQANAENCDRVKKGLASLKSGVRLSTTNNQGEREPMDDAARSAEAKRLEAIIQRDCRAS